MHWQDLVLSVGTFILVVALVPSVIGPHKPAVATSFLTAAVLITFAAVYVTLHLWISVVMTLLSAALWLTLALQKILQTKRAVAKQ